MCRFQRFRPEDETRPENRKIIPTSGQVSGMVGPETSHAGNDPPPVFQEGFLDPDE
jgi:hypothetical protein